MTHTITRCPPELGRHPTTGDLLNGRSLCRSHYCGWCCGCAVCKAGDREWSKRAMVLPGTDTNSHNKEK